MNKQLIFIILLGLISGQAFAGQKDDCRSLMLNFIAKAEKQENLSHFKNGWKIGEQKKFLRELEELDLSSEETKTIIDSLNMQTNPVTPERAKNYLTYALTLSEKDKKIALLDLAQLDTREVNSKFVKKFAAHEKKLQQKFASKKMSSVEEARYKELYYGCRALSPNEVNKNAARDFKRFNLALNLGTLGASYAFYNMDKEKDTEWWAKLGYDLGTTIFFSYVGGKIQTNPTDTQIVKSIKGYFSGRLLGTVDILIYDPVFSKEQEKAEARIEALKNDPNYKEEVDALMKDYEKRGLYRKLKGEIIETLKKLPEGISLGIKGNSVDENNVDWNNLSHADLDRPEVQEVLVAASMMQIYNENKGEWIDTGDAGLDRYTYNSTFYAIMIPKSIVQNFITYRMLCMGQDNAKVSFTKAVIFNVASNFIVNQALFGYRHKAINQ
jgi:hypothetical protein